MSSLLRPVVARDGTVWDGSIDLVLGRQKFYGSPRDVNVVEDCPEFSANSEIVNTIFAGSNLVVLGWTRGNMYKSDDRYWVDADGSYIPVYATAEKPV